MLDERHQKERTIWVSGGDHIVDKNSSAWLTEFDKFIDFITEKLGDPFTRDLNKSQLCDLVQLNHQTIYSFLTQHRSNFEDLIEEEKRYIERANISLIRNECPFSEIRDVNLEYYDGKPVNPFVEFYGLYYRKDDVDALVTEIAKGQKPEQPEFIKKKKPRSAETYKPRGCGKHVWSISARTSDIFRPDFELSMMRSGDCPLVQ